MKNIFISVGAVLIAIGALVVVLTSPVQDIPKFPPKDSLGAAGGLLAENYMPYVQYNGGYYSEKNFQIGANGSDNAELKATTCDFRAPEGDVSVVATSSIQIDCAVTGIASGDVVFAQLATSTKTTALSLNASGWDIISAKASSTAGFVTMRLYNGTGVDQVPSAVNIGSSTNIWYVDT